MTEETDVNILVILQGSAYGDERNYNGLRLATSLTGGLFAAHRLRRRLDAGRIVAVDRDRGRLEGWRRARGSTGSRRWQRSAGQSGHEEGWADGAADDSGPLRYPGTRESTATTCSRKRW